MAPEPNADVKSVKSMSNKELGHISSKHSSRKSSSRRGSYVAPEMDEEEKKSATASQKVKDFEEQQQIFHGMRNSVTSETMSKKDMKAPLLGINNDDDNESHASSSGASSSSRSSRSSRSHRSSNNYGGLTRTPRKTPAQLGLSKKVKNFSH